MKSIAILGSTGSIGTQALDIIDRYRDRFRASALSCGSNIDLLMKQILKFRPQAVCVANQSDADVVKAFVEDNFKKENAPEVTWGISGLKEIATMEGCQMVLNSLMGMRGLEPTLAAIEAGKDIAFANKETLVVGGELVMEAARRKGIRMLPVDSEHSAIFQALQGSDNPVRRIILTASGGPFRGKNLEELQQVSLKQALKHPNWSMGSKITIDSATMMNKGLEVIEAKWLFDVPLEKIQIVVHPQSVLHSAVEFEDGSIIGQMGNPDMRVPIGYAFSYPQRLDLTNGAVEALDFFSMKSGLEFYPADREVFKTIDLAYEAAERGGSYPVVLNGANEVLVDMFLNKKISFIDIQNNLIRILENHKAKFNLTLEEVLQIDRETRDYVREML